MASESQQSFSVLPIPDGKTPSAFNSGMFQIVAVVAHVAYQGPGYPVGHQGIVRVRSGAGNVGGVYVGLNRGDVIVDDLAGGAYYLAPNTEVTFPVDNLAQIWFSSPDAGSVIQISVKGAI